MSYALNMSNATKRITLSSTGEYNGPVYNPTFHLTTDMTLSDGVLNLVSLESVQFTHPTIFSEEYMTGTVVIGSNAMVPIVTVRKVTEANFNVFLKGLYMKDFLSTSQHYFTMDQLLFHLLHFLKTTVADNDGSMIFDFGNDEDNASFLYNNLSWDEMDMYMLTEMDFLDAAGPHIHMVKAHGAVIDHVLSRKNMKLTLQLASFSTLTLGGNFCTFFGLDPTQMHRLTRNEPLQVRIPSQGHNYIALECSLISPQMVSMNGERLTSSELLTIVPTPKLPGEQETYITYTTGGKSEVSGEHIDAITLTFTDAFGNKVFSMKDFVVVFVLDQVSTVPVSSKNNGHFSLFHARVNAMEQLRKK